jgi:hypothetical protein
MTAVGVVNLNGIVMQGFGPAVPGFYFINLTDWYSLPEAKTEVRERPLADGAFGFSGDYRQAAVISIDGIYLAEDRFDLQQARGQLMQAARGAQVPLTFTDEEGPTTRLVSVRSMPMADDHGQLQFRFSIDVLSMDPNRYGPVISVTTGLASGGGTGWPWPAKWPADWGSGSTSDGRATVTNSGTAATWPLLRVTGGLSLGAELVEIVTGNVLRLDRAIPTGSTAYFTARTGRVYLDDTTSDITGFLTRREWWSVPPGETRTVQINPLGTITGTPTLTVSISPAY